LLAVPQGDFLWAYLGALLRCPPLAVLALRRVGRRCRRIALQGDTVTQAKGMPFETPAAPSRYDRQNTNLFLREPLPVIGLDSIG